MQLELNREQAALVAEVQSLLDGWSAAPVGTGTRAEFVRALSDRGWTVPAWPERWGGAGLSADQAYLIDRSLALAGAPLLAPLSTAIVGPLLMEVAGPDDCGRWLPDMARGESTWCAHSSVVGGPSIPGRFEGGEGEAPAFYPSAEALLVAGAATADFLMALAADDGQAALVVASLSPEAVAPGAYLDPDRVTTQTLDFVPLAAARPEPTLRALVGQVSTGVLSRGLSRTGRLQRRLNEVAALDKIGSAGEAVAELGVLLAGLTALEERLVESADDALVLAFDVQVAEAGQALAYLAVELLGYYALPAPDPILQHNELPLIALTGHDAVGELIRYVGGLEVMSARDRIAALEIGDQRED